MTSARALSVEAFYTERHGLARDDAGL